MPPLATGVTLIATTRRDNAFLVDGDDGFTLVDVGWAKAPGVLLAAVDERGRKPGDIKRIVLTHAHPDHVKGAAELRRRTGARILIHEADAGWLEAGRVPKGGRSGAWGHFLDGMPALQWKPVTPDALLTDDELIEGSDGLRVVHTPGHTPGHIVLVHEPSRSVLVGDALFNRGGLEIGPAAMAADPSTRASSLTRIPHHATAVGFAHGAPLTGTGVEGFHEFVRRLSSGE
ncbi:MBL fold metallo-hydrolase [Streptomyces sp. NPDC087420]|uniref:MBL fold metallo-hydrolase n=1 Tax=Streptomyces sp. NPDC087420 TaxID=3365785 RepID=UPI003838B5C8